MALLALVCTARDIVILWNRTMWLFRGRKKDDSDFESDYDSDEYETDDEELDSEEEAVVEQKAKKVNHDDMPERTEINAEEEEPPVDSVESGEEHDEEDLEESYGEELEESREEHDEELQEQEVVQDAEQHDDVMEKQEDENEEEEDKEATDNEEEEESEEEEEATSLVEKQSLLALAAEHDRVDILKAILSSPEDRDTLLHSNDPPLHIAISYGSTNATSCLLRMGANPAIRPSNSKHEGISAWELAFGVKPVDMAPSKREGIRHAFTAEALRCIGSDEAERLKHLLDSGMPPSIDIGGKNLHGWCIEMNATRCEELTRPFEPEKEKTTAEREESSPTSVQDQRTSAVISHPDSDSLLSLDNRLEELESLAKALSSCLDNLAEEVSVCHGLLLLGGGASALASHVRSLKMLKERREGELEQCAMEWNDSQDELAYWLQQSGGDEFHVFVLDTNERKRSFTTPTGPEEEEAQKLQLKAQIAASENKVRKLRASITDLSEENARDLVEVERRGLSGGIKLVRTLREELREVEFHLSEAKSGTAACRARVNLIVARLDAEKKKTAKLDDVRGASSENGDTLQEGSASVNRSTLFADDDEKPPASDRIASGNSEAIAVRQPGGRGYFSLDLWEILLRIIGLGRVAVKKSAENLRDNTPSAMII